MPNKTKRFEYTYISTVVIFLIIGIFAVRHYFKEPIYVLHDTEKYTSTHAAIEAIKKEHETHKNGYVEILYLNKNALSQEDRIALPRYVKVIYSGTGQ